MCVLSLPLDLSVADFCEFLGAYLGDVQQMRFMQREGARAPCLVVLTFAAQGPADQFFRDYNSKPVRRGARWAALPCQVQLLEKSEAAADAAPLRSSRRWSPWTSATWAL